MISEFGKVRGTWSMCFYILERTSRNQNYKRTQIYHCPKKLSVNLKKKSATSICYKLLSKEIKEDLSKLSKISCSIIRKLNTVKVAIYSFQICLQIHYNVN